MSQRPDVMKLAVGRWPGILMNFGLDEKAVSGKHGPCPLCEGKDRFRVITLDGPLRWICNQCGGGDGMDMLMAITNLDFKQAADKLRPVVSGCAYVPPNRINKIDRKKFMKKNVELWKSGLNAHDNEVFQQYMAFRGLQVAEYERADLRLVPKLDYYNDDGKMAGQMPAMLARISTRDGKLASIHRTYLAALKEGGYKTKKKMTSSSREWRGGCIRLFDTRNEIRLIVAEGIETALSVRAHIFRGHGQLIPCWAAGSANAMENIAIPDHIKIVMVAGDNDNNYTGQKAAFVLANRLVVHDKRNVRVVLPRIAGDFNDELRHITQESKDVSG